MARPSYSEENILRLTRRQIYPRGRNLKPDFMVHRVPILDKSTPIGSIGSCFAARMKTFLKREGFNYVQTSEAPGSEIGSAAWGTVYNTACIAQEFSRAFGDFNPIERHWPDNENGGLSSPYRKGVGWPDPGFAAREKDEHAEAVRLALTRARVFILTVGLSEIWFSKRDGSVFYQPPPAKVYHPDLHGFRFATVGENVEHLRAAIGYLRRVSPECRVILTVSPVPLRATFRKMNVLTANAESKASLLIAVQRVTSPADGVHYFPSYELVSTVIRAPFKPDHRHPRHEVTDTVWEIFTKSFLK